MHLLTVTAMALFAVTSAEPAFILSGGFLSSPFTSAALVAPGAAPVIAPVAPGPPIVSYPPVAPVAPVSPLSQVVSDYRYAYGSSISYQDYSPIVNSALSLPYSLPYAYAADWYYRK